MPIIFAAYWLFILAAFPLGLQVGVSNRLSVRFLPGERPLIFFAGDSTGEVILQA